MNAQTELLMTAEQFEAMENIGSAELVRGRVVSLTKPKPKHGRIAMKFGRVIGEFVEREKLGEVYAAETGFLIERDPDTVRAPDVAYVRSELVLDHDDTEWYPHSPDLAVEVLSPNDRPSVVEDKVQMWLDGGGRSVWVVDADSQSVTIHRADGSIEVIHGNEVLQDHAVLPGFAVNPLASLFR